MAGVTTATSNSLIRSNIWSQQLKDVLTDELMAQSYVNWLSDFPDGNTINIPSIGLLDWKDYLEDQAVEYTALDTGNFTLTINNYISSATYITNKAKQDGYYMSQLISQFVPKEARAIKERLERDIFVQGQPTTGNPAGYQVAGNLNLINGGAHRFVGSDVVNSKQVLGPADFAHALFTLKRANVPQENLIAIVDPSVEYHLNTLTNLVNVQNNARWEGIVADGIGKDLHFVKNVYGFDVYTSQRLPLSGQNQTGASETINSVASTGSSVACLFFSATSDILPWVGAWRQMPQVDAEYNKDFQREEYVTTARYGVKIFRPENLVVGLTDPSVIQ
jgi:hypothetical protein